VENKSCIILGGTGTLGKELIKRLHKNNDILVISRDEHKHQSLKKEFPKVRFALGDIRNIESSKLLFKNKDVVFHVAALKHVDYLEDNPMESLQTNTLASFDIANVCIENNIKHCVFSSTDKAVYPINTYGFSKALSEKIFLHFNTIQDKTKFKVYRWPNVIGSTGSALPYFVKLLKEGTKIPVTDARMTRFWIKIDEAVDFVLSSYYKQHPNITQIYPKLKSASLLKVIDVLAEMLEVKYTIHEIGMRKGEKLHEDMTFEHEYGGKISSNNCYQYTRDELKELFKELI